MALKEKLEILVDANVQGFVRGMDTAGKAADKNLSKTDDHLQRLGGKMTSYGALIAGAGAVAAVGLGKLASMAADAETQQLKLTNSIENSTYSFTANGQALRDQASALQRTTAAEDDATVSAQALLVQFGLTERQVLGLTPLVVDLSQKMGVGIEQAAKSVGKAVDGSAGALKKMGINLDENALAADGYGTVMEGLRSTVGGYAAAEGKTFAGQLQITKNLLGELGEGVGSGVLDTVKPLIGLGADLANVNPELANTAGRFLTIGTAAATAGGGVLFLAGQAIKAKEVFPGLAAGISAIGVGPTVGLAAVAVGIGVITTKALESKTSVEDLQAALTLFAATGNSADLSTSIANLKDDLSGSVDWFESWVGTVTAYNDQVGKSLDDTTASYDALLEIARTNPAAGALLVTQLSKDTEILNNESFKALGGIEGINAAIEEGKQIASGAAKLNQENADSLEEVGTNADYAAEAWKGYTDAIRAATDPYFAAIDAQQQVADAQSKVNDAFAAFSDGATPEEFSAYAAANLDLAKAGLDAQSSLAALRGEVDSGKTSVEDANNRLTELVTQFPELGPAADVARDAINGVSAATQALPTQAPPISITADTTDFFQKVGAASATEIPDKPVAITGDSRNVLNEIARIAATKPPQLRIPIDPDEGSFWSKFRGLFGRAQSEANANPIRIPSVEAFSGKKGLDGGIVSFAMGGMTLPQNATIQPGSGNGLVQWAEAGTGGEAFIPLGASKRKRSKDIWWQTGQRLGVVPMEDGGLHAAAGGVMSFANGGFTSDNEWGQAAEALKNYREIVFNSLDTGGQIKLLQDELGGMAAYSDEWTQTVQQIWSLQAKQAEDAARAQKDADDARAAADKDALAAAQDRANNEWQWTYDHADDMKKLMLARQKQDAAVRFSDDWVRWAKEVESLTASLADPATGGSARSSASGGKSSGSAPFYLTVNVNAEGLVTDPSEVGRQVVGAIKSYEQQNGPQWRQ